jgi:hypothetical protein
MRHGFSAAHTMADMGRVLQATEDTMKAIQADREGGPLRIARLSGPRLAVPVAPFLGASFVLTYTACPG